MTAKRQSEGDTAAAPSHHLLATAHQAVFRDFARADSLQSGKKAKNAHRQFFRDDVARCRTQHGTGASDAVHMSIRATNLGIFPHFWADLAALRERRFCPASASRAVPGALLRWLHSAPTCACFSATERFIIRTSGMSTSITAANIQKQSK
jgi:hypothetical protein